MKGIQHTSNTRALGAPKGWDQSEAPCNALPVTDCTLNGVQSIKSYWKPDADELAMLNAGYHVTLYIVGAGMPPVALGVEQ